MKRKIYSRLLEWKEKDNGSCALLLDGARRVGKSYIAEQFGKNLSGRGKVRGIQKTFFSG